MAESYSPQLDIVFKLLFAPEKNREILIALLNDILKPQNPIKKAFVVNPETKKHTIYDRGLFLDILVVHDDGSKTDIEMQIQDNKDTEERALYHWARMYHNNISTGDPFKDLVPCRVIFIVNYNLKKTKRMHTSFKLINPQDNIILSDHLDIHLVELPKLAKKHSLADDKLVHWARFFKAKNDKERQRAAMTYPIIHKANQALKELSQDPETQRLIQWRQDQIMLDERSKRIQVREAQEKALKEGRNEGLKEGRNEGLKEGRNEGLKEGRNEGLKEGRNEGLKEGRNEGLKEGQEKENAKNRQLLAQTLEEMIILRFGSLAAEQNELINNASIDTLLFWQKRLLLVENLEQLFTTAHTDDL